jgi:hypothetical protein
MISRLSLRRDGFNLEGFRANVDMAFARPLFLL